MSLSNVQHGMPRERYGPIVEIAEGISRGRSQSRIDSTEQMIKAFYHPGFAAPIGDHIMPMRKFGLVAEALKLDRSICLAQPEPIKEEELRRVRTWEYTQTLRTGPPRNPAWS